MGSSSVTTTFLKHECDPNMLRSRNHYRHPQPTLASILCHLHLSSSEGAHLDHCGFYKIPHASHHLELLRSPRPTGTSSCSSTSYEGNPASRLQYLSDNAYP